MAEEDQRGSSVSNAVLLVSAILWLVITLFIGILALKVLHLYFQEEHEFLSFVPELTAVAPVLAFAWVVRKWLSATEAYQKQLYGR